MKIISGIYKGRNLLGFDLEGTRPTMDRVKESLFAMIQVYIKDGVVLDLFSGSGNLAIEALSEGAKEAVLVDKNHKAVETIKKNITTIGVENTTVLEMDYHTALKECKNRSYQFDCIFLDPPYKTNYIEESIKLIMELDLVKNDGIIVCESDSLDKIIYPNTLHCTKDKKYGDKYIVLLKKI